MIAQWLLFAYNILRDLLLQPSKRSASLKNKKISH